MSLALAYVLESHWALRNAKALAGVRAVAARLEVTPEMVAALHAGEAPSMVAAVDGPVIEGTKRATMRDGVAVLPVRGVICRYGDRVTDLSGATSVASIAKDMAACLANPSVKSLALDINSPGGSVDGIGELAAAIRAGTATKPIVAVVGNQACSAAYYLAAACSRIVVAPMAFVGSIGVIATYDTSEDPDSTTVISTQSPRKRVDPRKESGRALIQAEIDGLAKIFIGDVARYRGVAPSKVASDFGKGGVVMGAEAVKRGMADAVDTYESTIDQMSRGKLPGKSTPRRPAGRASGEPMKGANAMTFKERLQLMTALFGGGAQASEDADAAGDEAVEDNRTVILPVVRGFAPAPNGAKTVLNEAEIRARIEAEVREHYEAQARDRSRQVAASEAHSFLSAQVKAGKVRPAESAFLTAIYVDAYMADSAGLVAFEADGRRADGSRVAVLKSGIEARPASPAVRSVLGSGPDAAARLIPDGHQVLPNEADPAAEEKARSKATIAAMLAAARVPARD